MKTLREISDGLNAVVKAIGVGKLSTMYESPRIKELADALSEHVSDEVKTITGVALHTIERGDRIRILGGIAHMIPPGFDDVADEVAKEKAEIVQRIADFQAAQGDASQGGGAQSPKPVGEAHAAPIESEADAEVEEGEAAQPQPDAEGDYDAGDEAFPGE